MTYTDLAVAIIGLLVGAIILSFFMDITVDMLIIALLLIIIVNRQDCG